MKAVANSDGTFTVTRRGGFLWLKQFRAVATYRYGWYWANGDEVDSLRARLALWDAEAKAKPKSSVPIWEAIR